MQELVFGTALDSEAKDPTSTTDNESYEEGEKAPFIHFDVQCPGKKRNTDLIQMARGSPRAAQQDGIHASATRDGPLEFAAEVPQGSTTRSISQESPASNVSAGSQHSHFSVRSAPAVLASQQPESQEQHGDPEYSRMSETPILGRASGTTTGTITQTSEPHKCLLSRSQQTHPYTAILSGTSTGIVYCGFLFYASMMLGIAISWNVNWISGRGPTHCIGRLDGQKFRQKLYHRLEGDQSSHDMTLICIHVPWVPHGAENFKKSEKPSR